MVLTSGQSRMVIFRTFATSIDTGAYEGAVLEWK
jgi:hypothetical protein